MIKENMNYPLHLGVTRKYNELPSPNFLIEKYSNNSIEYNLEQANEIANYVKQNNYDIVIAGKESSDYNSGAVPEKDQYLWFLDHLINHEHLH